MEKDFAKTDPSKSSFDAILKKNTQSVIATELLTVRLGCASGRSHGLIVWRGILVLPHFCHVTILSYLHQLFA